ncbi:hypothetical protein [Frigoriglobus tundricola]|uniref:Lipocalin-like domain-containing protein n=1 Tax=Frigoriglobus tundricola TaxID=2774151 RepID=A0A6M5YZ42_9BACT|nr:hypothetical protein [Frigoriglobus tundricola]QJW98726.1 hypothetical protein FTUN_6321 [Frigoriglobus tundricola]
MIRRAGLVLVLLSLPLRAAPVPPQPRLTEAHLVGTWHLEWGGVYRGPCTFWADGTYRYEPDGCSTVYLGRWWVERGVVVLHEQSMGREWVSGVTRYELRLTGQRPYWTATVAGAGTKVVLRE